MHIKAKMIAFLGLLLSCTVLLVIFSGIIETNTLFLLAAASFFVGVAIRESGLMLGFGFFIAATLLSFILAPNKLYCITFSAMALYILLIETIWEKRMMKNMNWNKVFFIIKVIIFNLMYIPVLMLFKEIIFPGGISKKFLVIFIILGQIALVIYDIAYRYFQRNIWGKIRVRLHL